MVDGVLDKPDDHHHDRARYKTGDGLHHEDFGGPRFIQRSGAGDHGDGEGLQEVATQKSADQAGDCVTDRTEGVLMGCDRCDMASDKAGNNRITRLVRVHVICAPPVCCK